MHVCTGKTPSPALLSCFMHLLLLFFLSVLVLHFDPPWNLMGALLFITALVHHLAGSFILTDSFVYSSKTERLSDIAWSKLAENIYYRFGSNTPCSIFTLVSCWLPTNSFWPDTAKRGTTLQSDGNHSVHYVFAANVFICNHYTQTVCSKLLQTVSRLKLQIQKDGTVLPILLVVNTFNKIPIQIQKKVTFLSILFIKNTIIRRKL